MRKRSFAYLFDCIFWYTIYLLPIILMVVYYFKGSATPITAIGDFCQQLGINFSSNPLFEAIYGIFGVDGIFPLLTSSAPLYPVVWFLSMFLVHLAVDVLLFIPRLCHQWIDSFKSKM